MNYRITHITQYLYHGKVSVCHNESRLTPKTLPGQICNNSILSVDPWPRVISERNDFFGNTVHYFSIENPQNELKVTAVSHVSRIHESYQLGIPETLSWEGARDHIRNNPASCAEERQYVFESPLLRTSEEAEAYALRSFTPGRPVFEAVHDLMSRIYNDFDFDPEFSTVSTPLSAVLKERKGVCQDFAHLGIACIRAMGLPARYVSGYIETVPPPGTSRLTGADASHAWFSVYIPNTGWLDFDPTNNQMINARYITVAYGRDYSDVVPLKGVIFSSGGHELKISVDVLNLDEA
ncbi:MAG: transglutaminase N-terminal domain-containing protein [Cytophagaceae bacterium]